MATAKPKPDAGKLVRSALKAYVKKDRKLIESVLAPDYHFTSPLDNQLDRDSYFEICWPHCEHFDSVHVVHLVVDGTKAFVIYEAVFAGQQLRNCERHTMRGGKLVETEVYFGWSVPHEVPFGKHQEEKSDDRIST